MSLLNNNQNKIMNTTETIGGQSQDFARFVELQQRHTASANKLAALEVDINVGAQSAAEASATDYIVLQESVANLEAELKGLFERHPEWRADKKSLETPYGTVAQRSSTELEVIFPAMTVSLIENRILVEPTFRPDRRYRLPSSGLRART